MGSKFPMDLKGMVSQTLVQEKGVWEGKKETQQVGRKVGSSKGKVGKS